VLIATRDPRLAARMSDQTAFLDQGELVEIDDTARLFSYPRDPRTERYLTGRFA
jgi:phosphate transport system ATP-binding protein